MLLQLGAGLSEAAYVKPPKHMEFLQGFVILTMSLHSRCPPAEPTHGCTGGPRYCQGT